jgi:uncharacterized protein (TIRG00374 family)
LKLKVVIGIVISAVFIYLTFRQVDLGEMFTAIKSANYLWLIPGLALMFLSHAIRAYRWRLFLEPIQVIKFHPLFSAVMVGYASNNIFPLRLGEFLRAFAIGRSQGISKTSAFATIIVERLIDLLSLLVLLAATVLFYPLPDDIKKFGYLVFAVTASIITLLVLLMQKTEATIRVLQFVLPNKLFHMIHGMVRSFLSGFVVFKKAEHYLRILISSILIWGLYAAVVYTTFFAFDLPQRYDLSIFSSVVVLVIVSIGIMIPSSPGFVGTYHWFCMKSLALYGIPESEALSYAVISHALNTVPFTVVGLLYFWKENLHFSDALAEKEMVERGKSNDDIVTGETETVERDSRTGL